MIIRANRLVEEQAMRQEGVPPRMAYTRASACGTGRGKTVGQQQAGGQQMEGNRRATAGRASASDCK
jgi:hypothetical protein